jgi:molybdate transport system ATP-binding protein
VTGDAAAGPGGTGPGQSADAAAGLLVAAEVSRGSFTLGVDLAVPPGQVVGVLGPNGAGKSTLLKALAGLTPVARGRIVLRGRVIDDAATGEFAEAAARPVGFVFQDYRLFPHLSVAENVAFAPRARGAGRSAARLAAADLLARLGLTGLAERRPGSLSGGQAQRVALARALAGDPYLLLLDEPLSALDAGTRLDVQAELRRHLSEFAGPCLLVTHDPLEALVLADRLVVIEDGRVVQDGSPAQVSRQPATEYVARLVGLNLYPGRGAGGAVMLDAGGSLAIPGGQSGPVLVAVRPSSVTVSVEQPHGSSARNTWPGRIAGLTMLADRIRVSVDGKPPVLADVTPAAVAELDLRPGREIWLAVKATDLEVYAPGPAAGP